MCDICDIIFNNSRATLNHSVSRKMCDRCDKNKKISCHINVNRNHVAGCYLLLFRSGNIYLILSKFRSYVTAFAT